MEPKNQINGGLLFFISFFLPPGANYMLMGLIKRGLAAMCGFFLIIYMIVSASAVPVIVLLALSLPVYSLTCVFDGFNIRRRINAGEHVEDGISDILDGILRNKKLMLVIFVVIAINFAWRILGIGLVIISHLINFAIPLAIIALVVYMIMKSKKK